MFTRQGVKHLYKDFPVFHLLKVLMNWLHWVPMHHAKYRYKTYDEQGFINNIQP